MLPVLFAAYLQASDGGKAMLSFREKLPAFKMKAEFLKAVAENQVLTLKNGNILHVGLCVSLLMYSLCCPRYLIFILSAQCFAVAINI